MGGFGTARDERRGLWALYSAPHVLTLFAILPLAVFLLGTGVGARASGAFPRWIAWLALVVAALLTVGAGSTTGDELTRRPLAVPLLLGIAALLVWPIAAGVSLWRTPRTASIRVPALNPAAAASSGPDPARAARPV